MSRRRWSSSEPLWHKALLDWYDANGRDLPWRRTRDPYRILVSELMCQQTQVGTVIPYYERWIERFPTAEALAMADEQEVLSYWQGLGYYRRARFLLQAARQLVQSTPASAKEWREVPGVGRYTAGALASICHGQPEAVVDGNVERVYSRLNNDAASGKLLHESTWQWATTHVNQERPGDWNQALMELGAMVCKPVQPLCVSCPVSPWCEARQANIQDQLPTKEQKPKTKHLKQHVCVPHHGGRFGVRQIAKGQWWEGMWEFPREDCELQLMAVSGNGWQQELGLVRHTVTNHRITLIVSLLRCESAAEHLSWHTLEELTVLPMPAPQRKVLRLALPLLGTE